MRFLFDSKGNHIANERNGQLHAITGQNIGHFMPNYNFFIDMNGRYLGEILFENRLVCKNNHPYKNVSFGCYGNYGNIGNYGNPGNHGSIGQIPGYSDTDKTKLR